MRKLRYAKQCAYARQLASLDLQAEDKKNTVIGKLFIEAIEKNGISYVLDAKNLAKEFDTIDKELFSLKHEYKGAALEFERIAIRLESLIGVSKVVFAGRKFVEVSPSPSYKGVVEVNLVLEIDANSCIIAVFNRGKNKYTKKLNTKGSFVNNPECLGLYLAAKQMGYQNVDCVSFSLKETNLAVVTMSDEAIELALAACSELQGHLSQTGKTTDFTECSTCRFSTLCQTQKNIQDVSEVKVAPAENNYPLTAIQESVVNFSHGVARVNAGAGTGKTTIVVNNVLRAIADEVTAPHRTLLITFTEKGAQEMKEKFKAELWRYPELDETVIEQLQVYTFNGFGDKLVKENFNFLGYTDCPRLIDEDTRRKFVAEQLDKIAPVEGLNYENPYLEMFKAKGAILRVLEVYDALKAHPTKEPDEKFASLFEEYNKWLITNNYIEYGDQVRFAAELLARPKIAELYHYSYIVVDEFQDTNSEQLSLIKQIYDCALSLAIRKEPTLIVVGDVAQAIFGFRGVGPDNIINFKDEFPKCIDFRVNDNFRSTSEIVEYAKKAMADNDSFLHPTIISEKHGEAVHEFEKTTPYDAVKKAVIECEKLIKSGLKPHEIALIATKKSYLLLAQEMLAKRNQPSEVVFSEYIRDNQAVIAISSLASWIRCPKNTMALASWYLSTHPKAKIEQASELINDEAAYVTMSIMGMNDEQKIAWFMEQMQKLTMNASLKVLQEKLIERQFTEFSKLVDWVSDITMKNSGIMVKQESLTKKEAVTLTTIHASKGKEWKAVVFVPFSLSQQGEDGRLRFVGATRAREILININEG